MGNILPTRKKEDPKERRFSSASSRQQKVIIKQLRETQNRKKKSVRKGKKNINKIVPIAIECKSDENCKTKQSRDDRKISKDVEERKEEIEIDRRDANEELNLKAALTHPTIVKFLRAFMLAQNSSNLLDFYLDAVEIRGLFSGRYYKGRLYEY
jgi:hypothetical protein